MARTLRQCAGHGVGQCAPARHPSVACRTEPGKVRDSPGENHTALWALSMASWRHVRIRATVDGLGGLRAGLGAGRRARGHRGGGAHPSVAARQRQRRGPGADRARRPSPAMPGAPAFTVVPRKDGLTFYPCTKCHAALPPNPQPRKLVNAPHPAALDHGKGRIWCLDCHQAKDRDVLHTLGGSQVDFDDAYLVCGQCHLRTPAGLVFRRATASAWRTGSGDRARSIDCTHCHDPHSPALKPRAPSQPPPVRAGLQPMPRSRARPRRCGSATPPRQPDDANATSAERRVPTKRASASYRRRFLAGLAHGRRRPVAPRPPAPAPAAGGLGRQHAARRAGQLLPGPLPAHDAGRDPAALARIERKAQRQYGVDIQCEDTPPLPGVVFGYALNISQVQGLPRLRGRLRQGEQPGPRFAGAVHPRAARWTTAAWTWSGPSTTTTPTTVPVPGKFYLPVQCMQCDNPPCVKACPVERHLAGAGRHRRDRLRLVHRLPLLHGRPAPTGPGTSTGPSRRSPPAELNPNTNYLGNRPRPKGVVEKCHFCTQRTRKGRQPACQEACPTGARIFGNLLDPEQRDPLRPREQEGVPAQGRTRHRAEVLVLHRRLTEPHDLLIRFIRTALREMLRGGRALLDAGSACWRLLVAIGVVRLRRPAARRPGRHRHERPGVLGLLHRELRVPGRASPPRRCCW